MKEKVTKSHIIRLAAILFIIVLPCPTLSQDTSQNQDENIVILDYEASKKTVVNESRQKKNQRFNHYESFGRKITDELPAGVTNLPVNIHWWRGISALPVKRSSSIVIAKVKNAQAYLSQNKTVIYSEFELDVEKVFLDYSGSLKVGSEISVTRLGGGIRFRSGKVDRYLFPRRGYLKKDLRYLLFIDRYYEDLPILTGYSLSSGRAKPIDGQDSKDTRSALPFNKYLGVDAEKLFGDLRILLEYEKPTVVKLGQITKKERAYSKKFQKSSEPTHRLSHSVELAKERGRKGELNKAVLSEITKGPARFSAPRFFKFLSCISDAIIVGTPLRRTSHVTEDETWAYTEYDFSVKEVIKANTRQAIKNGEIIKIARSGGLLKVEEYVFRIENNMYPQFEFGEEFLLTLNFVPETKGYVSKNPFGTFISRKNGFVSLAPAPIPSKFALINNKIMIDGLRDAAKDNCKKIMK